MDLMNCPSLAVPDDVMRHVVHVESAYNPYAIGVVGGRLARQPRNLAEALATVRVLEERGFNFSVGLAQVNRYNLARYGLDSYERAFEACPNLQAGSRILAECYGRSGGSWGKSFSCYYSGNFTTGFRHGYVQKIYASMRSAAKSGNGAAPIEVIGEAAREPLVAASRQSASTSSDQLIAKRTEGAGPTTTEVRTSLPLRILPAAASEQIVAPPSPSKLERTSSTAVAAPRVTAEDQAFVF